jgi:hypothetical protein
VRRPAPHLTTSATNNAWLPANLTTALLAALCGSEFSAGDALVATTKQDCSGSSGPSEHGQIAIERLPRYAYRATPTP